MGTHFCLKVTWSVWFHLVATLGNKFYVHDDTEL